MKKKWLLNTANTLAMISLIMDLTSCSSFTSASLSQKNQTADSRTALWNGNSDTVWAKLQPIPSKKLAVLEKKTQDPVEAGWIQLALINKRYSTDNKALTDSLITWQAQHPTHPGNALLPKRADLLQLREAQPPQHIAVLLPQNGTYGKSGQAIREGFLNAYFNGAKLGQHSIKFYNTSGSNITAVYQQAVNEGADIVIGPLLKENVEQLKQSGTFSKPALALNYTNHPGSNLPTHFYEFGLLPEDEANQIAFRAHLAGHHKALVIAPQNEWGRRMASSFASAWTEDGGTIQGTWYFGESAQFNQGVAGLLKIDVSADKDMMKNNNNKQALEQQRRQDFDVIFLFAQSKEAKSIVPLLHYYYVGNVPIYATSTVYAAGQIKEADLNGVIVCDIPWRIRAHSGSTAKSDNRLYAVGQDAYLLSQSLDRMTTLPAFPVYGATGALTLSQQQIHRRLPCITIRDSLV